MNTTEAQLAELEWAANIAAVRVDSLRGQLAIAEAPETSTRLHVAEMLSARMDDATAHTRRLLATGGAQ